MEYEKSNKGNPTFINCILTGGTWHSTADPIVNLYRKFGNESFNQVDFFASGQILGNVYSYVVNDLKEGEVFYCTMHDIDTYRSEEKVGYYYGKCSMRKKAQYKFMLNFVMEFFFSILREDPFY